MPLEQPNIIVIVSDDQGSWAMGCAGNQELRTPHLDRLAAGGMRFENFFCVSPVCSPARASILTGRIPSAHGIHDWICAGNSRLEQSRVVDGVTTWDRAETMPAPEPVQYLAGVPAYPQLLARSGYDCGFVGKWHLGSAEKPQSGFAFWRAYCLGGGAYYDAPFASETGEITREEGSYITETITAYALEFLKRQAGQERPFYLHVCYTAPHSPWDRGNHPAETWDDYFADCPFASLPNQPACAGAIHPPPRNEDERRARLAGYFTAVSEMDKGVGLLLDRLEQMGVRERTLVIFTSDNGMNMGHHGIYGKGNATFPQNMFDTSVKVPCIVAQPGVVPAGVVRTDLCSHYDLFSTICAWAGVNAEASVPLPGRDLGLLLRGETMMREEQVVVFSEYGPVHMLRDREWKYVRRYPYGPDELFDLVNDPGETVNLLQTGNARDYDRRLREMRGRLTEWFARYADPALDGRHEPVTGAGQCGPAGALSHGNRAFAAHAAHAGGGDGRHLPYLARTPW